MMGYQSIALSRAPRLVEDQFDGLLVMVRARTCDLNLKRHLHSIMIMHIL